MQTTYDYSEAGEYAADLGLVFDQPTAEMADTVFARLGLTQEQVTGVVKLHAWIIGWRFNPAGYTFRQRLGLAWHFLRGRPLPGYANLPVKE